MTFDEWESSVPQAIRTDPLWKVEAYRLSLFLSDLAWRDAGKLLRDQRTHALADQLFRSVGNISSNVAEGYSRGTAKDRAHFYEYALGSAREARDWYFKARHLLGNKVAEHRIDLISRIVRLSIATIVQEKRSKARINPRPG